MSDATVNDRMKAKETTSVQKVFQTCNKMSYREESQPIGYTALDALFFGSSSLISYTTGAEPPAIDRRS
jgi:hypothetical protein